MLRVLFISWKEKEINTLRKYNSELRERILQLQEELSKFETRSIILEELEREKATNKIVILKVVENFSKECLEEIAIDPNDVIYMLDGSGGGSSTAEQLIKSEICAIITNTLSHSAYEQFRYSGITVIPTEEILPGLKTKGGVYYIDKPLFDKKLRSSQEKQNEMNRQEAESWLKNIVSDYRKRKDKV